MRRHDLVSKFVDFETLCVCVYVSYVCGCVCMCLMSDPGDRLKSLFKIKGRIRGRAVSRVKICQTRIRST